MSGGHGHGGHGHGLNDHQKSSRTIYIGNIPYEATEEHMMDIFSRAGQVVSLRLVHDRETGKPKGYGFCEYGDMETAQSAIRNLNNVDYHGRPLRVGFAAGDSSVCEALSNPIQPVTEKLYGDEIDPAKAPEAISKAVASLPPDQMFELMRQMKTVIQTNPNEARQMLLQYPQLAYALLQAQVVMKIVDPQAALGLLQRSHDYNAPFHHQAMMQQQQQQQQQMVRVPVPGPGQARPPMQAGNPQQFLPQSASAGPQLRQPSTKYQSDPRTRPQDPRSRPQPQQSANSSAAAAMSAAAAAGGGTEKEKAALIMEVMRLTPEQISLLPEQERQSIIQLKAQITKNV